MIVLEPEDTWIYRECPPPEVRVHDPEPEIVDTGLLNADGYPIKRQRGQGMRQIGFVVFPEPKP